MADNTTITAGSGTTIATDQIPGTLEHYQKIKLADGTADSTQMATVTSAGALKVDVSGTTANGTAIKVDGSAVTQPVSAAALPLPTGAATAAKQPALGTAGTASADVISVQGVASMTALKVDGSAVTQPVSGTVGVSGTVTVDSELTTADVDTGAGTDTRAVVGLVGAKSGGGVLIPGDATKGLAVDLTATGANTTALKVDGSGVTQPVSVAAVVHVDDNASTLSVDDGGGSLTVDGTVAVSGTVTVDPSGVTSPVKGGTASGSAVANAPVTVGGRAATTSATSVSDGQVVNAMLDKQGAQVAIGALRELLTDQHTTISVNTETTVVTADATYFLDVYGLIVTNTSASNVNVTFKDATGGTTRFVISVPANDTRGFMLPADAGHKQAVVNNNWTATVSSAVTSIEVTALVNKRL